MASRNNRFKKAQEQAYGSAQVNEQGGPENPSQIPVEELHSRYRGFNGRVSTDAAFHGVRRKNNSQNPSVAKSETPETEMKNGER